MSDFQLVELAADSLVGTVIDERYQILERIGVGGMASVYKARHLGLDSFIALKLLHETSTEHGAIKRFQNEAKFACGLSHPNIAKTTAFGVHNERPYIVMEFIAGQSLAARLAKSPLVLEEALPVFQQCCDALRYAHEQGLIHRDIKPSNIMIDESLPDKPRPKVTDFGIATTGDVNQRLTKTGELLGSPSYMSPEQWRGELVDTRSDIYSFGCLMYETLTGQTPFDGANSFQIMIKHLDHPCPLPSKLDSRLKKIDAVILKTLAKDPLRRYQSFEQLLNDLRTIEAGGKLTLPSPIVSNSKWAGAFQNRKLLLTIICALAMCSLAATAFCTIHTESPNNVRPRRITFSPFERRHVLYTSLSNMVDPKTGAIPSKFSQEALKEANHYLESSIMPLARGADNMITISDASLSSHYSLINRFTLVYDFNPEKEADHLLKVQDWRIAAEESGKAHPNMERWKAFVDIFRYTPSLRPYGGLAVQRLQSEARMLQNRISNELNENPSPHAFAYLKAFADDQANMLEWAETIEVDPKYHIPKTAETERLSNMSNSLIERVNKLLDEWDFKRK